MFFAAYQTQDLPSEEAARGRRQAAAAAKKIVENPLPPAAKYTEPKVVPPSKRKRGGSQPTRKASTAKRTNKFRKFNLRTYKAHSFGGYAKAIRLFGTTDNYSSQMVCFFN